MQKMPKRLRTRALRSSLGSACRPLHYLKCPACGKKSWLNIYSSVKDPVSWPVAKQQQVAAIEQTEEELEKKHIEESKYEKS